MGGELRLVVLSAVATARVAGGSGAATLARRLGVPAPTLLDDHARPFVRSWTELAEGAVGAPPTFLVANEPEAAALRASCPGFALAGADAANAPGIEVDRGELRGPAGALRDLLPRLSGEPSVRGLIVAEASVVPFGAAAAAVRAMALEWSGGASQVARVGADAHGAPLGVALVPIDSLARIAAVGYQDFKEQFLPALHAAGIGARVVAAEGTGATLRSREQYLSFVAGRRTSPMVDGSAQVSPRAEIRGATVVGRGAAVAEGAVVIDSVLLPGARVARGAVVARSVVGPQSVVGAGEFLADEVVAAAPAEAIA